MSFKDIDTDQFKSKRDNPLTKPKQEETKLTAHKTIRIYEEDYLKLKNIGFYEDRKMVEVTHDTINVYEMLKEVADTLGISAKEAASKAIELLKNK